ncbi:MAG TPA: amidohydrolase [Candidatus Nitrosotenuis sp.]|nr:amidohydrolase [Candidatus Nitrosotenuis sp.]
MSAALAISSFAQKGKDALPPASLILTNARVWTAEPKKAWAEAIAIRDNRILAVGTAKEIAAYRVDTTKIIDLGGRFAMPGFNDAHIHFGGGALRLSHLDLNEAKSLQEMQAALRKFAAENPKAAWLQGFGWQYSAIPGGLPTRKDLDAVVPDRPVFLSAYDGHTAWANSRALEIAGVTAETKFTGFGEIVVDSGGAPTGILKEGAMGLVRRHIPAPTREERKAALRRALKMAAALGITSIQNMGGDRADVELYKELLDAGELTVRVSVHISVGPQATREQITSIAALKREFDGPMLRVGGIKILVDGVIETHTAAMLDPYADAPGNSGSSPWTQEALNRIVAAADRAGLQVAIHAIGDRGVRMALDAFEYASQSARASEDPRFRIEHIETVSAQDIPRFAKLSVLASMQPIHADPGTIDVWSRAAGPERVKRAFAWRELEKAGARLVFASDWPACISVNPIRGLHVAVNRQTPEGTPPGGWVPEQKVSVDTALYSYTRAGAFASFEKNLKGSLAAGRVADIIVLSDDPFKIKPADFHKLRVRMTLFDGKVIFEAKD